LKYLNHGLAVIPIWRDARKNPHLKDTKEFNNRLPTPQEWARWARNWPNANIGLITGYWLNYVALDFDDQLTFDIWRKKSGEFNTWIVKTRRGYHVWFRVQDDPGQSRLFIRGDFEVLLRAKGGYCIAPPSIHHTGAKYHTINKALPLQVGSITEVLAGWQEKTEIREKSTMAKPYIPHKTVVKIEDLVKPVKEHPNTRGAFLAYCPFHTDDNPSAWVNPQEQRFGCNACWPGQWWDVINVYAMLNSVTNGQAFKDLRVRA
jgi:hypothetical protein